LMVYTLNKRLMDTSAKAQESILLQYRKEMNELALKYEKQLSAQSEKALALTLAVTQETISKSMKLETEAARQKFQHMANVNLVGSVLTLVAAAVVLWEALGN
jgi:Transcriptional activator TraM